MSNAEREIRRIAHLIEQGDLKGVQIDVECARVAWFLRAENERISAVCIKENVEWYMARTFERAAA